MRRDGRKTEIMNSIEINASDLSLKECFKLILTKDSNRESEDKKHFDLLKFVSNVKVLEFAYLNLRNNKGADTPGIDKKTFDGLSELKLAELSSDLLTGRYKCKPVRRVYISKKSGGERPLGVPCAIDKIVQEAIRMCLEYIYEPRFSNDSHGFRSGRSCHTALNHYRMQFQGTS